MTFRPSRIVGSLLLICALLCAPGGAEAQTTRPAPTWDRNVAQLADAACGKDLKTLSALLANGPVIRNFASEELQPPERLLGATTGLLALGVHAYPRVPATLATDMAADVRNAADIPEHVRERMVPADEEAEKRSNETAAQWLVQALKPAKDQPVAVIMLWRQDKTDTYTSKTSRPVFLLVKGQLVDGQYVFRQLVYGDPLDAPR